MQSVNIYKSLHWFETLTIHFETTLNTIASRTNALESKMKGMFSDLEQAIRIKYTRVKRFLQKEYFDNCRHYYNLLMCNLNLI